MLPNLDVCGLKKKKITFLFYTFLEFLACQVLEFGDTKNTNCSEIESWCHLEHRVLKQHTSAWGGQCFQVTVLPCRLPYTQNLYTYASVVAASVMTQ